MKRIFTISLILSLFLVCTNSPVAAQDDFIVLHGRVIDSHSEAPLHFASITLGKSSISNVSNSEGYFTLKIPADTPDNGQLSVSFLGYHTFTTTIDQFKGSTERRPYIIELSPVAIALAPARVSAGDAQALFFEAYSKIDKNYSQESVGMSAFYREMVKRGNTKYLSLNEAILDIEKAPYSAYSNDKVSIYKGRGSINYDSSDTLYIKYQGGVLASLYIDLVKRPFAGVWLHDAAHYYKFSMGQPAIIDGELFQVVEFDQRNREEDGILFRGKLYIEAESLAIGHIEFYMNVEDNDAAVNIFIPKKPSNIRAKIQQAKYIVHFKEKDGLWYYDYARLEVKFNTRKKYALFRTYYSIVSELAVTHHKTEEFKIGSDQRLKFKDILSEKVSDFTDEYFWENYNVIEPDETIENIIKKIVKQLKKRENI